MDNVNNKPDSSDKSTGSWGLILGVGAFVIAGSYVLVKQFSKPTTSPPSSPSPFPPPPLPQKQTQNTQNQSQHSDKKIIILSRDTVIAVFKVT